MGLSFFFSGATGFRRYAGTPIRFDLSEGILSELEGDASMTWPEFVDFFRQTGAAWDPGPGRTGRLVGGGGEGFDFALV